MENFSSLPVFSKHIFMKGVLLPKNSYFFIFNGILGSYQLPVQSMFENITERPIKHNVVNFAANFVIFMFPILSCLVFIYFVIL